MTKIIAVDFDGTLCENRWPNIGEPNKQLIAYLREEQRHGAKIILWTCRVGTHLNEAIDWCEEQKIRFDTVNENLPEIIEAFGGESRKIFANEYIDDRALHFNNLPYQDRQTKIVKRSSRK